MRIAILGGILLLLVACSSGQDMQAAEQKVALFHRQFNGEQFETIYADADPLFRQSTPKADYMKFISAVRRKLGKAGKSEQQGWNVNYGTGGTTVNLTYQTEFEEGPGVETFVYLVKNEKPLLYSYNVNSVALITN